MKIRLSKFLSMILIAALIMTGFTGFSGSVRVSAAEEIKVYVTISDKGKLVLKQKTVEVSDVDGDGALTIADALTCAHEKYYDGDSTAAGFAYSEKEGYDGYSIDVLWGDDSGAFMYYLNDGMAWSLADPINDGDYINAFVFQDQAYWSDAYTFFNSHKIGVKNGGTKKVTLSYYTYDENWNIIPTPLANAKIIINEKETEYVTNKKGKVTLKFDKAGSYFISAVSDDVTIVPPSCLIFVQPKKGDTIEVKNVNYTVTKLGKVSTGKKGKVTFSKSANGGKTSPKTIEYAGVTYKVKVVD